MLTERLVKFLLERAFGRLLKGRLDVSNLKVNLSEATVSLQKIWLDEVVLTDLFRESQIPFVVNSVFLGGFSLQIPWNDIVEENTRFDVENIFLSVEHKAVEHFQTPELKDWPSMLASSILGEDGFTRDHSTPFPMENEKIEGKSAGNFSS